MRMAQLSGLSRTRWWDAKTGAGLARTMRPLEYRVFPIHTTSPLPCSEDVWPLNSLLHPSIIIKFAWSVYKLLPIQDSTTSISPLPFLFPCLWSGYPVTSSLQSTQIRQYGFVSRRFTDRKGVVCNSLRSLSQSSINMRFSTLVLALIPATSTLAVPVPAPGARTNTNTVQNGPNLTYRITKHRIP